MTHLQGHLRGGRGHKAPYKSKMVRIPLPLANQVANLVSKYHDFVADGGDAENPPEFIAGNTDNKPVNNFEQENNEMRDKSSSEMTKTNESQALKAVNNFDYACDGDVRDVRDARDDYLASLKLSKQAPEYERAKKYIDGFIAELAPVVVQPQLQEQTLEPLVEAALEIYEIGKDNNYLFSMLNKIAMQSSLRLRRDKAPSGRLYSDVYFITPYDKPSLKLVQGSSIGTIVDFLKQQRVKFQ